MKNRVVVSIIVLALIVFSAATFAVLKKVNTPNCGESCNQAYLSYIKQNDPASTMTDNAKLVRGKLICANLRGGSDPNDLVNQIQVVDPKVSIASIRTLTKAAAQYLCVDQRLKVDRAW